MWFWMVDPSSHVILLSHLQLYLSTHPALMSQRGVVVLCCVCFTLDHQAKDEILFWF